MTIPNPSTPKPLSFNAREVVRKRYSRVDADSRPYEDWAAIARRIAAHVAAAEAEAGMRERFENEVLRLLLDRRFLPNTPAIVNAGTGRNQLAACFVTPVEDSLAEIMEHATNCALIHQSGGGVGMTYERLRPEGAPISGGRGAASGPVSFMQIVNTVTETVKQGGVRRGANMGILSVTHPDLLRFIHAKNDQRSLTNFNISVTITDRFLEAVENGEWFQLEFGGEPWTKPIHDPKAEGGQGGEYSYRGERPPRPGMVFAPDVWDRIISSTHRWAEPGIIFIDNVNRANPLRNSMGPKRASNPCFVGGTRVALQDRWVTARELAESGRAETFAIDPRFGAGTLAQATHVFSSGIKPVVKVETENGQSIRLTPDHKLMTDRGWVAARDLTPEDVIHTAAPSYCGETASPLETLVLPGATRLSSPVRPDGEEEVFDVTVPVTNSLIADGYTISNCGEQLLHDYNACNLGSLDVAKYYDESRDDLDWEALGEDIRWAVRFLDNVVEVCDWPLPQIADTVRRTRPVGLGIMGFADLLLQKRLVYGSEESAQFAEKVMGFVRRAGWEASLALGVEKGVMPEFEPNRDLYEDLVYNQIGIPRSTPLTLRNYEVTTIAPTGTISLLAESSSGCEPNFSYAYVRRDTLGTRVYAHPIAAKVLGIDYDPESKESTEQAAAYIEAHRADLPPYFVDALSLTPEAHIKILAAFQRHVDNSISKTINAPASATLEDTDRVHRLAWKMGAKAVSYYRDGSRDGQVLTAGAAVEQSDAPAAGDEGGRQDAQGMVTSLPGLGSAANGSQPAGAQTSPAPVRITRPKELSGWTWQIGFDSGTYLYVTVNHDGECVREVFCSGSMISNSVGMLISKMLRGGFTAEEVTRTLEKNTGTHSVFFNQRLITSPEQAIAECIKIAVRRLAGESDVKQKPVIAALTGMQATAVSSALNGTGALNGAHAALVAPGPGAQVMGSECPKCREMALIKDSGCDVCVSCYYSKCG